MAKKIAYSYKGEQKLISFAQDKYHSMFEAIAAAEGIDLTKYLEMEQQVALYSKSKNKALRNFRDTEFARMGFTNIRFIKE